ncbi:hypothetical protein GCM10027422_32320 [Hymenobacter arcticus]
MIYLTEVVVLAARARHGGSQLAVAHGPAQGNEAAHYPEHQQRKAALDTQDLETEAGKNAGTDHVSNNDGRAGAKIYLVRLSWHAGKGRTGGLIRSVLPKNARPTTQVGSEPGADAT